MKVTRTQQLGSLTLACGLALLIGHPASVPASVSQDEMIGTFGGLCWRCKTLVGCNVSFDCKASTDNKGKFEKQSCTKQGEAECAFDAATGKRTCGPENMPLNCTTLTTCDDNKCMTNCTSITTTVPTNCPMTGSCTGS